MPRCGICKEEFKPKTFNQKYHPGRCAQIANARRSEIFRHSRRKKKLDRFERTWSFLQCDTPPRMERKSEPLGFIAPRRSRKCA